MEERVLLSAQVADLAAQTLPAGGCFRLQVHGGSMRPWIYDGDRVNLCGLPPEGARRGDVLLSWEKPGWLTMHRAIRISPDRAAYFIRGDILGRDQGHWVESTSVFGRVAAIERDGRIWSTEVPLYRLMVRLWLGFKDIRKL